MTMRRAPGIAGWLLKKCLSETEFGPMLGDIAEQYQHGRSGLWYWQQVLAILFLGRRAPVRKLLRGRAAGFFGGILALMGLGTALLSETALFVAGAIVGGIALAAFMQHLYDETSPGVEGSATARIDSSRITAGHGIGAGMLIVLLLSAVLVDLPLLRLLVAPGLAAGLVFAVVLQLWRRVHPPPPRVAPLRLRGESRRKSEDRFTP
jgi:hypothetical protein